MAIKHLEDLVTKGITRCTTQEVCDIFDIKRFPDFDTSTEVPVNTYTNEYDTFFIMDSHYVAQSIGGTWIVERYDDDLSNDNIAAQCVHEYYADDQHVVKALASFGLYDAAVGNIEPIIDDTHPCMVWIRRYFLQDNADTFNPVSDQDWGHTRVFDTAAEAKKWVEDEEADRYLLGNNEATRPTYYIARHIK